MIEFSQMGTKVKLSIDPGMSNKSVMFFYWECGTEWYAELMVANLRDRLQRELKNLRMEEYEEGWSAAKAKKAKKTYFRGWF